MKEEPDRAALGRSRTLRVGLAGAALTLIAFAPKRRKLGFLRAFRRAILGSTDPRLHSGVQTARAATHPAGRSLHTLGASPSERAGFWTARAIHQTLDDHIAINNRGVALMDKGEFDRAITDFDRPIRLTTDYLAALGARAMAYGRKGLFDRALADLDLVIKADPRILL
ncbi:hypothetical protein AB4853_40495 [Bradyrhizobium sp. 1050_B9_N1_2]|uniref:hypothetical protein n=1 Tax=Bradyrhizobium sp. 1050_B9_N1_2 TaxID=3238688 RepID=UPI003EDBEC1C